MRNLDERVAYMEGRMEDHAALMADIRVEMRGSENRVRGEITKCAPKSESSGRR